MKGHTAWIVGILTWTIRCWAFVLQGPTSKHNVRKHSELLSLLHAVAGPSSTTATTIETFLSHVSESVDNQSFNGFVLHGPKAGVGIDSSITIRGKIKRVQGRPVVIKKKNQRCIQVTFKFHGATDVAKNYDENEVVDVVLRPLLEGISVVDSEWGPSVTSSIGSTAHDGLQGARLETTSRIWEWQATFGKKQRLVSRKVKGTVNDDSSSLSSSSQHELVPSALAHDRIKQRPLSSDDNLWSALGLTNKNGQPKPGKKAKLTQAQKFVEIVSRLIDQQQQSSSLAVAKNKKLQIFDMGCGRGYLTFALHKHLTHSKTSRCIETFGIDVRPKLVKDMNELARSMDLPGLEFLQGTIEEYMSTTSQKQTKNKDSDDPLKVWLALHACDTATDDALWSGIVQKADIIVVAPCCHKELRPQLDRSMPLPDVLRHGIFRQRWAATLTDSIRALLLEMAGYQVQVMEFVQMADTPQNVMITAVKVERNEQNQWTSDVIQQRLVKLTKSHGVEHQALATWMGVSLSSDDTVPSKLGHGQMPPL